jgi:tripartite-type tricarboxylate transporter receptor subunit TctC
VPLAVAGDKRSPILPGVPSLADAGIKGVQGDIWYGLFGPKGMAPELVAILNAELREVLKAEEKALGATGIEVETGSAEDFRQLMVKDSARWAALIKAQGIKPD